MLLAVLRWGVSGRDEWVLDWLAAELLNFYSRLAGRAVMERGGGGGCGGGWVRFDHPFLILHLLEDVW